MTTTLLVPLDGSEKDERVLPAAAALAELAGGDLHLIHVLDTPIESLSQRAMTFGALDAAYEIRREMELSTSRRETRRRRLRVSRLRTGSICSSSAPLAARDSWHASSEIPRRPSSRGFPARCSW